MEREANIHASHVRERVYAIRYACVCLRTSVFIRERRGKLSLVLKWAYLPVSVLYVRNCRTAHVLIAISLNTRSSSCTCVHAQYNVVCIIITHARHTDPTAPSTAAAVANAKIRVRVILLNECTVLAARTATVETERNCARHERTHVLTA